MTATFIFRSNPPTPKAVEVSHPCHKAPSAFIDIPHEADTLALRQHDRVA